MRVLSGIQPSGEAHLGNYFGMIKPNVDLQGAEENVFLIADLHALTSVQDPEELRRFRQDLTLDLLACGIDPKRSILFFQSYVPEHAELAWILSCVTPMGILERAVSYKEKVQKGLPASAGLFTYPVLQAADILLYDADVVPVGADQKQHLEMARDIAVKFNNVYGNVLVVPEARIRPEVAVVPGTDGQKMSKSYGNTIPLFAPEKVIERAIMSIVTDSKTVAEPKDPESCTVSLLHRLLLGPAEAKALAQEYRRGGMGYGEVKKRFLNDFLEYFSPVRKKREEIARDDTYVQGVIQDGARKAQEIAGRTMLRVRNAVGLF